MKAIIAHHFELIEDANFGIAAAQALDLVVNLLDIAFAAGRADNPGAVTGDAVESFLAHLLRQHDDAVILHTAADERAADAVIAG